MQIRAAFVLALALFSIPASSSAATTLKAPEKGRLRVAFVMTEGATMIDFAGPWEVFQDVHIHDRGSTMEEMMPFELFTVGASKEAIRASGGMSIVPDYAFADAPPADIIVVGAQRGAPEVSDWLNKAYARGAVVMSVCTGASILAKAGLLDGKEATTHHSYFDAFEERYPKVTMVKERRYVESGPRLFTAGGLSSGIDLALHVVALYFGEGAAEWTAQYMEYGSDDWRSGLPSKARAAR